MQIVHGVEGTLGSAPDRFAPNGGNGRRDVFHVSYDPTNEEVTEVVIRSVAVIHNADPADLPPLGDAVDPDALSALFGPGSEGFSADAQVTFVYEDLEITIDSDGNVWFEWV